MSCLPGFVSDARIFHELAANLLAIEYRQQLFVCADVALILGILELVFANVLPKLFWSVRSGGVGRFRPLR